MACVAMTASFLGVSAGLYTFTSRPPVPHRRCRLAWVVSVKAEAPKVSKDIDEKVGGEIMSISSGRRDLVFGVAAAVWSIANVGMACKPILPVFGGRRERMEGAAPAADDIDLARPFVPIKIAAINGELNRYANNRGVIRAAKEISSRYLKGVEVIELETGQLPLLDTDLVVDGKVPPVVEEFRRNIAEADAILFSNPEYNYSVSGATKNAIDWGSYPVNVFGNKTAAIVSTGEDFGGARSQYQLRQMGIRVDLQFINTPELFIRVYEPPPKFDKYGNLIDPATRESLKQLLESLQAFTLRLKRPLGPFGPPFGPGPVRPGHLVK